jgi:uncharacterized protein YdhG (YjbR/CyaY superfamily)
MTAATIDVYIAGHPAEVQDVLRRVRAALHEAIPGAGEKISYQMPTLTLDGRALLYFAGWKHHLGLYPVPVGDGPLETELAPYRSTPDTLKFLYKHPIPYTLIGRIGAHLAEARR